MLKGTISRTVLTVALTLVALWSQSLPAEADPIVPTAQIGTEGNADNGYPFNIGPFGLSSMEYQQVYAASEFGSSPLVIAGIAFRPDSPFGEAFASTLPAVSIYLSTTTASVGALGTTLADNLGSDNTLVRSGPLFLSSNFTGPLGGPKEFDIRIPFTTPFTYNPTGGNLLLYVINSGGGRTTQFDASFASSVTSRAYTSASDPVGLVTQFQATPVPEPASLSLLALGLAGLGLRRWRQRKA